MTSLIAAGTQLDFPEAEIVLHLDDDADVTSVGQIAAQLDLAARRRPERITIDLSACRFLDAQVAGLVWNAVGQLRTLGVRALFRGCRPEVSRLFALLDEPGEHEPMDRERVA